MPETNELITFDDEEQIADYAAEAVDAMQKAGIINGMDNNEFPAPRHRYQRTSCQNDLRFAQSVIGVPNA